MKDELDKIDNIVAQEVPLYSDGLGVAGRVDCIAEYNGKLRLYGEIVPGGTREQNTFSKASWLVTDMEDTYLGYFRTSTKVGKALIPKI